MNGCVHHDLDHLNIHAVQRLHKVWRRAAKRAYFMVMDVSALLICFYVLAIAQSLVLAI